jgi:hypothetical protein
MLLAKTRGLFARFQTLLCFEEVQAALINFNQ